MTQSEIMWLEEAPVKPPKPDLWHVVLIFHKEISMGLFVNIDSI